jgi:DNA-directed RNA polymerase specialized sigma24 family protein
MKSRKLNPFICAINTALNDRQESVNEILGFLSEKHQKLVLMYAAGFTPTEIAEELAYGSPQAVSNQLRRIQEELKERMESTDHYKL